MNLRPFSAIAALLFSTAASPVLADTEYKLRALSVQDGVPATEEVHAHAADGSATAGPIQVKNYLNHEFDTLKLKSPKLVFTAKPDPASAKDPAEVIGSCELPAKGGTAILLFTREAPDKSTCTITVVDDSEKAIPKGSIWIANLTTLPVRIELEKKPFEFKPGEIKVITDPPVGPSNSSGMKGTYEANGKWQNFASGVWPHPGKKRKFQVLTETADRKIESIGVIDVFVR